jgi:hypothetical protein
MKQPIGMGQRGRGNMPEVISQKNADLTRIRQVRETMSVFFTCKH